MMHSGGIFEPNPNRGGMRCNVCLGSSFEEDDQGFMLCMLCGTQSQDYIQESQELEDGHAMVRRRLKVAVAPSQASQQTGSTSNKVDSSAASLDPFERANVTSLQVLEAFQAALQIMMKAFIVSISLSPSDKITESYTRLVRELWFVYLKSMQSFGIQVKDMFSRPPIEPGQQRRRPAPKKYLPQLSKSLLVAILYAASRQLRLPLVVKEFVMLVKSGDIPYLKVFSAVTDPALQPCIIAIEYYFMKSRTLVESNSKSFISCTSIIDDADKLAAMLGLVLPPLNRPLIALRVLVNSGLIKEICDEGYKIEKPKFPTKKAKDSNKYDDIENEELEHLSQNLWRILSQVAGFWSGSPVWPMLNLMPLGGLTKISSIDGSGFGSSAEVAEGGHGVESLLAIIAVCCKLNRHWMKWRYISCGQKNVVSKNKNVQIDNNIDNDSRDSSESECTINRNSDDSDVEIRGTTYKYRRGERKEILTGNNRKRKAESTWSHFRSMAALCRLPREQLGPFLNHSRRLLMGRGNAGRFHGVDDDDDANDDERDTERKHGRIGYSVINRALRFTLRNGNTNSDNDINKGIVDPFFRGISSYSRDAIINPNVFIPTNHLISNGAGLHSLVSYSKALHEPDLKPGHKRSRKALISGGLGRIAGSVDATRRFAELTPRKYLSYSRYDAGFECTAGLHHPQYSIMLERLVSAAGSFADNDVGISTALVHRLVNCIDIYLLSEVKHLEKDFYAAYGLRSSVMGDLQVAVNSSKLSLFTDMDCLYSNDKEFSKCTNSYYQNLRLQRMIPSKYYVSKENNDDGLSEEDEPLDTDVESNEDDDTDTDTDCDIKLSKDKNINQSLAMEDSINGEDRYYRLGSAPASASNPKPGQLPNPFSGKPFEQYSALDWTSRRHQMNVWMPLVRELASNTDAALVNDTELGRKSSSNSRRDIAAQLEGASDVEIFEDNYCNFDRDNEDDNYDNI